MIISCHQCSKKLKVPDSAAGKKVKCPSCGTVLAIAEESEAPVPAWRRSSPRSTDVQDDFTDLQNTAADYEDDLTSADASYRDYDGPDNPYSAPRARTGGSRKARAKNREGLETVGTGLLIQGWAIAAMIIALTVLVVATVLKIGVLVALAAIGVFVTIVAAAIAMLLGELMCLAAPAESNARSLIIAAVACHAAAFLINLAGQFGLANGFLTIIGGLAGLGYFVLFLLFLKSIAGYADLAEHAGRVAVLLIGIPLVWVCGMGGVLLTFMGAAGGGGAGVGIFALLLFLVLGLAGLVLFVMYVNLLFQLGRDLRSA